MTAYLPRDFAMQSVGIGAARSVSIGGSVTLLAAWDRAGPGFVQVAGLRPDRYYMVAGATHRFARADANGEALVVVRPDGSVLITLMPVI